MKSIATTLACIFYLSLTTTAQSRLNKLSEILFKADSVFIISHDDTGTPFTINNGKDSLPKLLIKGKLNYKMVHERVALNDSLRKKLSKILLLKNQSYKIVMNMCYMPQHAILIKKNNHWSFIDICFGCLKYKASNDLSFFNIPFDINKWNELYQFFLQNGMEAMYGDKISED